MPTASALVLNNKRKTRIQRDAGFQPGKGHI
jgi:hypothetical protein